MTTKSPLGSEDDLPDINIGIQKVGGFGGLFQDRPTQVEKAEGTLEFEMTEVFQELSCQGTRYHRGDLFYAAAEIHIPAG